MTVRTNRAVPIPRRRKSGKKRIITRRHHAIACVLPFTAASIVIAALVSIIAPNVIIHKTLGPFHPRFWWFALSGVLMGLAFGYMLHRYLFLFTADAPDAKIEAPRVVKFGMWLCRPVGLTIVIAILGLFAGRELLRSKWMLWQFGGWTPGLSAGTPEDMALWRMERITGNTAPLLGARLARLSTSHPGKEVREIALCTLDRFHLFDNNIAASLKTIVEKEPIEEIRILAFGILDRHETKKTYDSALLFRILKTEKSIRLKSMAVKVIAELGSEEELLTLLNYPSSSPDAIAVNNAFIQGINRRINDIDVALLQRLLEKAETPEARHTMTLLLDWAHRPESAETFVNLLKNDPNARVRACAAAALMHLRREEAVPVLLHALEDEDRNVRLQAAKALCSFKKPEATPALCNLLSDEKDSDNIREIFALLQHSGDTSAIPAIEKYIKTLGRRTPEIYYAEAALQSLKNNKTDE
ncbi:MAG: HEAT repeat domain-containing protein [Planctomycetota bacterium]|jgi:hypothetical protein